jgi:hypothetical protein
MLPMYVFVFLGNKFDQLTHWTLQFETRTQCSAPPAALNGKQSAVDHPSIEEHAAKRIRTSGIVFS